MKTKLKLAVLAMATLFFLAIPTSTLAFWDSPHEKADKLINEATNLIESDLCFLSCRLNERAERARVGLLPSVIDKVPARG